MKYAIAASLHVSDSYLLEDSNSELVLKVGDNLKTILNEVLSSLNPSNFTFSADVQVMVNGVKNNQLSLYTELKIARIIKSNNEPFIIERDREFAKSYKEYEKETRQEE
jgi:hypothetical protein